MASDSTVVSKAPPVFATPRSEWCSERRDDLPGRIGGKHCDGLEHFARRSLFLILALIPPPLRESDGYGWDGMAAYLRGICVRIE